MGTFNITEADILRSKVVKPGWYRARVERTGEKPAKTDGSTNHIVEVVIVNEGEFQRVPLTITLSEKAPGFAVKMIEALGGNIGPKGGSFNMEAAVGKEMEIFVDNDIYEGRLKNSVKDYRKVQ